HERIHNSFGSIQGGAVVILMEYAANHLAELSLDKRARCFSADVHYLSQAKGGPFEIRAELLARPGDAMSCRVRIVDVGHDDRLLSVGTVSCTTL
ncbi:MAG: PaaI family thioesterase, partial [Actinomycetota bacterium]|nr:PaaI family thioesterase [Actinomycetota bacterium]